MDIHQRIRRSIILATLASGPMLAGCAATPTSQANGRLSRHAPGYVRDYNAGRHATAYREASAAADADDPAVNRESAALIAGLSAQALGDDANAAQWLSPLLASRDRSVAGRAEAAMGLLAQGRGDHERAAALLSKASLGLTGDNAARAAYFAGRSFAAMGRSAAAHQQYQLAFAQAKDRALRDAIADRLNRRMFTIQLGAYTDRSNAARSAREQTSLTTGLGLGAPSVVVEHDAAGRTLYLVQVGSFRSQADAQSASRRLGVRAIVTQAPDDS